MNWTSPEAVSVLPQTPEVIDPEEVRRLYWDEGLSLRAVAERFGVNGVTILNTMQYHGIPRRSHTEAGALAARLGKCCKSILDSEEIRKLYWEEELSMPVIAERFGLASITIYYFMRRNNIPRRTKDEAHALAFKLGRYPKSRIDPDEIKRLYLEEELSMQAIGERLGMSNAGIHYIMNRDNISRRPRNEATQLARYKVLEQILSPEELSLVSIGKNKTYKFCPRCSEVKPVNEFHRNAAGKDGLVIYCKKCRQESTLGIKGVKYSGLHKRPFPLDGRCELCFIELNPQHYNSHHWDDNNLNLTIYACASCDYWAEGLDEIVKTPWKVDIYQRLKKEVEEAERTYIPGPFSPPDGIRRLFLNGEQTHKWCPHCGEMKLVEEFTKSCSSFDGLQSWCKPCVRNSHLASGKGVFNGVHKRPKPDFCEICNTKMNLNYHHFDDDNPSMGVWVCQANKCHNLCHAVDLIDSGSPLPEKYSELKQRIILEDNSDTRISNLEKRVTLLEAEGVLSEKQ